MITIKRQCESCGGTGLYSGMGECKGAAVVCHTCNGTGCEVVQIKNTPFTGRKKKVGIKTVYQANPGIGLGPNMRGGLPYKLWLLGAGFTRGTELREHSCPAWWYQAADYKRKPDWKECWRSLGNTFSSCLNFKNKAACWSRFDEEDS